MAAAQREGGGQACVRRAKALIRYLYSPSTAGDLDVGSKRGDGAQLLMPGSSELPDKFGPQLEVTRATTAENGIGSPKVGRECGESRIVTRRHVLVNASKVGMIQNVEELEAKLKGQVFAQLRVLAD